MTRFLSLAFTLFFVATSLGETIPPIPRLLPPEGIEIPAEVRERLENGLAAAKKRFKDAEKHDLAADVEIYLKAVEYALLHRELYDAKDFAKADAALPEANKRR